MGRKVCILLGFLLVFSLDWTVECASLQQHFRSQRDVELPAIHKSTDDLPVNSTDPSTYLKDVSNTTNINNTNSTSSSDQTNINNDVIQDTKEKNRSKKENISLEVKDSEGKSSDTNENKVILDTNNLKNINLIDKNSSQINDNENLEILNSNISVLNQDYDINSTKSQSGKETGRSLNIDIDKYVSPEFHNKNNVYILPTSPEIEKYLDPDAHDYTDHITESEFSSSSQNNNFNSSSTTPISDFFDSKFRLVADSIKQNLDEFDSAVKEIEEKHEKEEPESKYVVTTLIDNVKNKDNDTEVSLHVVETKSLEQKSDEKKGKKSKDTSIETGRNIDYKSNYFKTKTYDDKSEIETPNNISETKDAKTTEQTIEGTVKKVTIKENINETQTELISTTEKSQSTKKPRDRFSVRNNTIDNAKQETMKSKSSRQFTTVESSSFSPVHDIIYTKPATDNSINISKRGSTKYYDSINKATTPSPVKGIDFDDKGFSIPPSATAWSLATMKDVPIENNTESNNVTKLSKEQTGDENNIVSITVSAPQENTTSKTVRNLDAGIITTDFILNTDVITTEAAPKTTPTLFLTTLEDSIMEVSNKTDIPQKRIDIFSTVPSKINAINFTETSTKETFKTSQKNENEILKTSQEVPDMKNINFDENINISLDITPFILSTTQGFTTENASENIDYTTILSSPKNKNINNTNFGSTENIYDVSKTKIPSNYYTNTTENHSSENTESQTTIIPEITTIVSSTDVVTTEIILTTIENEIPLSPILNSTTMTTISKNETKNVTDQTMEPVSSIESVTERPLLKEEDNTKNINEENATTTKNTEKTSENEIITTKSPKNSTPVISTTKYLNKRINESETTESMVPVINIEKKQSTPSLLEPIEEVDENDNVEEIDNGYLEPNFNIDETVHGPMDDGRSNTPIETEIKMLPTDNVLNDEASTIKTVSSEEGNAETTSNILPIEVTTPTYKTTVHNPSTNNLSTTDPTTGTGMLSHDDDDDESNPGMIAAIAISAVAAVCLFLLAGLLIVMRKRQKRVTYGQRCRPVSLDAYSLDNVSVYNSVRRKGGIRASKRSYGNPAFDDPASISHQMNFQSLAKFNEKPEEIVAEFEEIPQVTARANEVPPGCETKNRYANIIPLPETRVFLKAFDNDPQSDYINANYVTGPKNTRGYYIACQAPMDNTIDDFWRMIWEQNSRVVLMLTNLYENGVEKCSDYLPPSEVLDCHRLFGDYQITLKKRDVKEKYIISSLQLKNMVSNSWREITHLWYLGWPERGVPSEANSLIAFLIEARSHLKAASNNNNARDDKTTETSNMHISGVSGSEGGPVVVHCSPGTGRTGTVISCDIAIRDFELTRAVDIPKIVYRVRRDRASAVQTKDQYGFIYKLITLYATKLTGGALDSI